MKSYYQFNNYYTLPPAIYRKTVKTIQAYPYYSSIANSLKTGSAHLCKIEKDVVNAAHAQHYIDAIDAALKDYVIDDYREAVFIHAVYRTRYAELEDIYGISESTMKRWVQKFIYGAATYLGDNFAK